MGEREAAAGAALERPKRRRVPRFLRRGITVFVLVLVFEYLVVPELVLAKQSLHALQRVNLSLFMLGLALEIVCQVGYAKLTLLLLPEGVLGFSKALRINLSALGVSHILPGGTAGGTGLGYRLMTTNGVSGTDVGFQAATQGIGSAVLLNAMLWLALIISIPLNGFRPVYVSVAIVTSLLLTLFGALVYAFTKGEGTAAVVLRRVAKRLRFIPEARVEHIVRQLAGRLQAVAQNRRLVVWGIAWAGVNWLADAACLWVCLAAFHYYLNPIDLFVAYGVGNVLAAIPLTPGGLGPVEAAVPLVLRGFGVQLGFGTLAVLAWRLFNFWLPIPVGAGCYVSLRVQRGASFKERRAALSGLTRSAAASRRTTTSVPPVAPDPAATDLAGEREGDPDPPDSPTSSAARVAPSWLVRLNRALRLAQRT